jgi:hypothetical protein
MAVTGCSKFDGADEPKQTSTQVAPVPATTEQNEDQAAAIMRACGKPSRDYEDNQAGTTWRHVVYGRAHVELIYQRFPGWTYIAATDPRDTEVGAVIEIDEVSRRLPCTRGKLTDPMLRDQ